MPRDSEAPDLAHRVVVLAGARVVEQGPTAQVFEAPTHAYTRQLLEASRAARAGWERWYVPGAVAPR